MTGDDDGAGVERDLLIKVEDLICEVDSHYFDNKLAAHVLSGAPAAREPPPSKSASRAARQITEGAMVISDVLRTKGHAVVRIRPTDSIELAVRMLAEHRIGALVVEDLWMKPVGIFSERDFINAMARDGAAVLGF